MVKYQKSNKTIMADIKDHFTLYPFIQQIFIEFLDVFWGWEHNSE